MEEDDFIIMGEDEIPSEEDMIFDNSEDKLEDTITSVAGGVVAGAASVGVASVVKNVKSADSKKGSEKNLVSGGISNNAESNVAIANKVNEEYNSSGGERLLRNKIMNLKGDDLIEVMLLLEDIIFRFDVAHGKNKDDLREREEYTKRLNDATVSLKSYILDMKKVADASSEATDNFREIIEELQVEITRVVQDIDLAPMQKGILDSVNQIISKMPINEINQGVTNFIHIAKNVNGSLELWKNDAQKFEENLYNQRKKMKETLDDVVESSRVIQKIYDEKSGKVFGWGGLLSAMMISSILTLGASVLFYQDFIGGKIDEIIKSVQTGGVGNSYIKNNGNDPYIIYDPSKMKIIKSEGDELRLYLDKK